MELFVENIDCWILDDQLHRQKMQFWGKKNYEKMNDSFLPPQNII